MADATAERREKRDPKPKRRWGDKIFRIILGMIFPPLAVAAKCGIGKDFWINLFLTLCGLIPGQIHNFYIQHIRDRARPRPRERADMGPVVNTGEVVR